MKKEKVGKRLRHKTLVYKPDRLLSDKQLKIKYERILNSEGLRAITDDYRGTKEFTTGTIEANGDSKKYVQAASKAKDALEYYSMLGHYCEAVDWQFSSFKITHKVKLMQFKKIMQLYVEGYPLVKAYKITMDTAHTPFSRIYYYKKVQLVKKEFLADFTLFSDYMQMVKYSYDLEIMSFKRYKESLID